MKFGKKANRLPIRAVLRDQPITVLLRAGGTGGARALQGYYDITNFWLQDPEMSEMANQWTLFQQGVGGQIIPTTLLLALQIFELYSLSGIYLLS